MRIWYRKLRIEFLGIIVAMAGEAISRNDVMAMMKSLRAEVTGNMTVALGTAISQLRGEVTNSSAS